MLCDKPAESRRKSCCKTSKHKPFGSVAQNYKTQTTARCSRLMQFSSLKKGERFVCLIALLLSCLLFMFDYSCIFFFLIWYVFSCVFLFELEGLFIYLVFVWVSPCAASDRPFEAMGCLCHSTGGCGACAEYLRSVRSSLPNCAKSRKSASSEAQSWPQVFQYLMSFNPTTASTSILRYRCTEQQHN